MASWRAPGSILEAPGLDFGRFGNDFFEIFERETSIWAEKKNLLKLPFFLENFGSDGRGATEWVAGGVPPRGLSIRRPTV